MIDEDRIVRRAIEITWGGEHKLLPVLPMAQADKWRELFVKKFPSEGDEPELDAAAAMKQTGGYVVDLMLAYDHGKVLGTREWVKANVTDDELADAFAEVYRRCFRLSRLPADLMRVMLGQAQPAKSPSMPSLTGGSIQTASVNGSATNS